MLSILSIVYVLQVRKKEGTLLVQVHWQQLRCGRNVRVFMFLSVRGFNSDTGTLDDINEQSISQMRTDK